MPSERKILILALAAVALLLSGCSGLLYYPSRSLYADPKQYGANPEEVWLTTSDNKKLYGWYFETKKAKKPEALVVFFHGNAENLSSHYLSLLWILDYKVNYFIFSYRGYGRSEGEPNPEGTVEDGKAALAWAQAKAQELKVPLIVFGQSLGGAISLRSIVDYGVAKLNPRAVIIDSSFLSYKAVGQKVMAHAWLTWPFQWLSYLVMSDHYAPGDRIKELKGIPLLVIHGDADKVVDYSLGQDLFVRAEEPKEFLHVPDGQHTDVFFHDGGRFRPLAIDFLNRRAGLHLSKSNETAAPHSTPVGH